MLAWIGTQHSQPRWHYITELCWSESLPMCCEQRTSCKMQQESVSLQHALQTFTEKNTHMHVWILYLCEDRQHMSQPPTPTQTPSQLNAPDPTQNPSDPWCRAQPQCPHFVGEMRFLLFTTGHVMSKRFIFTYSSADAWVCRPPRALTRAYSTFQTSFRPTEPLQHLEAAWENVMR